MNSKTKIYKRKKISKGEHLSERLAWERISSATGMTRDMIKSCAHTEDHWVFICLRPEHRHNVVYEFSAK